MKQENSESRSPANPTPAEKGTPADTRRTLLGDPGKIPAAPADYQPLPAEEIRALTKAQETMHAELKLAANEVIEQSGQFKVLFGAKAPDVTQMAELWRRYQTAVTGQKAAEKLLNFYSDVAVVAASDVLQLIAAVDITVRPASERDAAVAEQFASVLRVSDQRSSAIREGKARTKTKKAADPSDPNKPGA